MTMETVLSMAPFKKNFLHRMYEFDVQSAGNKSYLPTATICIN